MSAVPAGPSRYAGRVALVTGAGGGLGQSMCVRLASEGARVAALDIDEGRAAATRDAVVAAGGEALVVAVDVTNPSAVDAAVARTVEAFGRLDLAVNNAGMGGEMTPLADYPLAAWDRVLAVNLSSVFYGMRSQIPHLLKSGGGAIVNIASIMGTVSMAKIAPYVSTKHAVVGLTKAAALEYGDRSVRINAVGPSFVRTGFTAAALPDDRTWEGLAQQHALKSLARPEDIAAMVAFLGSEDARFVTGALHLVDGGYTAA